MHNKRRVLFKECNIGGCASVPSLVPECNENSPWHLRAAARGCTEP